LNDISPTITSNSCEIITNSGIGSATSEKITVPSVAIGLLSIEKNPRLRFQGLLAYGQPKKLSRVMLSGLMLLEFKAVTFSPWEFHTPA
jgi:hypothetical protein